MSLFTAKVGLSTAKVKLLFDLADSTLAVDLDKQRGIPLSNYVQKIPLCLSKSIAKVRSTAKVKLLFNLADLANLTLAVDVALSTSSSPGGVFSDHFQSYHGQVTAIKPLRRVENGSIIVF